MVSRTLPLATQVYIEESQCLHWRPCACQADVIAIREWVRSCSQCYYFPTSLLARDSIGLATSSLRFSLQPTPPLHHGRISAPNDLAKRGFRTPRGSKCSAASYSGLNATSPCTLSRIRCATRALFDPLFAEDETNDLQRSLASRTQDHSCVSDFYGTYLCSAGQAQPATDSPPAAP